LVVFCFLERPVFIKPPVFHEFFSAHHLQKWADFWMGSAQMMRCTI